MTTAEHQRSIAERVTLRPVDLAEDEEFLQELYFRSRDDLAGAFSDETAQRQILLMQYRGQTQAYSMEFPDADNDIILYDGQRVGRLMIDRQPDSLFGVDILLLPEWRANGIGTEILGRLFAECADRGVPFRLRVVRGNPAIQLYERLGCQVESGDVTHLFMRWNGGKG